MLLLIFSISKAYIDVEEIKKGKALHRVEFVSENVHYKSNSKNLFLGKTHEYLFIYNIANKSTQIFKISEVNELIIKNCN